MPLSCSLVWPTHTMSLIWSVGLVLRPRSLASIVGVLASDAAYSTVHGGAEQGDGKPLDEGSFDGSMAVAPGGYNEWRVRESDAVGVYAESGELALAAKKLGRITDETELEVGQTIGIETITVEEVHEAFPDLPVYTRQGERIVATRIPASVVYP